LPNFMARQEYMLPFPQGVGKARNVRVRAAFCKMHLI
jgi:hypothetical protein